MHEGDTFKMYVACWINDLISLVVIILQTALTVVSVQAFLRGSSRFIFDAQVLSGSNILQVAGLQLGLSQPGHSTLCLEYMN